MKKLKLQDLGRMKLEDYKVSKKLPLVLVLDNIRSHHNVGSAFRTADALGVEKLLLAGFTPNPPHREIQKTALGSTLSVDWSHNSSIEELIKGLKQDGYVIVLIEQTDDSKSLDEYMPQKGQKIALVFGNEVNGVSDDILSLADLAVEIPQFGTKHSFNVSVCIGIVGWDISNKIRTS
jgi:tRNA G18 (ribose-2'-O)-methylase SpoU